MNRALSSLILLALLGCDELGDKGDTIGDDDGISGGQEGSPGGGSPSDTTGEDEDPALLDLDGDGFAEADGDCDDDDAVAYPGASEVCDDVDNDCDGDADEDSAIDARAWYFDGDSDGYGEEGAARVACDQPDGYVHVEDTDPGVGEGSDGDASDFDCDDAEPEINPGADELCDGEGLDEDCDGLLNDDDPLVLDQPVWYLDADGDTYGDLNAPHPACEQPFGYEADVDDCDDTDVDINPAEAEKCGNLIDDDCDGAIDDGC